MEHVSPDGLIAALTFFYWMLYRIDDHSAGVGGAASRFDYSRSQAAL